MGRAKLFDDNGDTKLAKKPPKSDPLVPLLPVFNTGMPFSRSLRHHGPRTLRWSWMHGSLSKSIIIVSCFTLWKQYWYPDFCMLDREREREREADKRGDRRGGGIYAQRIFAYSCDAVTGPKVRTP